MVRGVCFQRFSGMVAWPGGEPLWNVPEDLVIFSAWRGRPNTVLNRRLPGTTARAVSSIVPLRDSLSATGLPVDEALIHDGSEDAESFDRLLSLKPTAILAGNNRSMIRLMQYLHTAELQVPRDIAVVGFDDCEWADYFHPRLTVIAQPIAKRAISLLAARIEDPEVKPQTLHIKPKLIIRESCGSASNRIPKLREKTRRQ